MNIHEKINIKSSYDYESENRITLISCHYSKFIVEDLIARKHKPMCNKCIFISPTSTFTFEVKHYIKLVNTERNKRRQLNKRETFKMKF